MADAEVGDDVLDGDPTTRRLEDRVAELLGKERGLFFPSGTMANQTAIWLFARRGDEIYLDANAHIVHYEMGGAAALAGAQIRPVLSRGAAMTAMELRAMLRAPSAGSPTAALVAVENTHNYAGGKVLPLAELQALCEVAAEARLPVHLDGARLWNASTATGTPLEAFAHCADTVMVSFSKGLGAPVGAVLAGEATVIDQARAIRKRFGGGMRQSGILAAAALHGLDHHVSRLGEDHANARVFAELVHGAGGARVVPPESNIVMLDLPTGVSSSTVAAAAAREDVIVNQWTPTRLRCVTHLDVTTEMVRHAGAVVAGAVERVVAGAVSIAN